MVHYDMTIFYKLYIQGIGKIITILIQLLLQRLYGNKLDIDKMLAIVNFKYICAERLYHFYKPFLLQMFFSSLSAARQQAQLHCKKK